MKYVRKIIKNNRNLHILAIGILLLLFLQGIIQNTIDQLIFIYFFIALAYGIGAEISIITALLLLFVATLTVDSTKDISNRLAMFAYYFLVIGVIQCLIDYLMIGDKIDETKEEN
jgi:hypothetical protein